MTVQRGRDMLVKIKTDMGDFTTVAGLRTKTLRFNARSVDITHSESAQAWRELLPGAGVKTAEISGSGVFRDASSDVLMREAFFNQAVEVFEFTIPDFGVLSGPFQITSLSFSGTYNGEASYEMSLASAGAPVFTMIENENQT